MCLQERDRGRAQQPHRRPASTGTAARLSACDLSRCDRDRRPALGTGELVPV